ncbi:MAG: SHOCT domain-containing protein, partial [Sulfuritalea sp.]|nr:SHOCT domain-containing protein [Sulfuritalea sp.]
AGSLLQQTDETKGRAGVMESKLIASSISETDLPPLDARPASPQTLSAPTNDTTSQKLVELQGLRKDGVISEDEFQRKKAQLLERL